MTEKDATTIPNAKNFVALQLKTFENPEETMIIRIVKLGFVPEQIDAFLENFEQNKDKIRNFEGCSHLKLIRDLHQTNQFFTYSHWESEEHLNNYRNSSLFKGVWANTKNKFNQKPEAWSVEQVWCSEKSKM